MQYLLKLFLIAIAINAALPKEIPRVKVAVQKRIDDCKRRSKHGDILIIHYKGTLENGTVFDTSLPNGPPYRFTLGSYGVIKGWDQGLVKMCVGEKRRLVVPPELAYGEAGTGHLIPPNAVLIFEIELIDLIQRTEL